jgi:hypothetical protein
MAGETSVRGVIPAEGEVDEGLVPPVTTERVIFGHDWSASGDGPTMGSAR